MVLELATETAASQFSSKLLRVEEVVGPMNTPIWGEFGGFPKKTYVCVFSPLNDSVNHLIPIINLLFLTLP